MSAEEEYLDRLLAQAMQPKKSNSDKGAVADANDAKAPFSASSDTAVKSESEKSANDVQMPKKSEELFAGKAFGNKDFSLDDVDAEQLAKEIADFEADADESILPGITDASDSTDASVEDAATEAAIADDGALAGDTSEVLSDEALLAALNETGADAGLRSAEISSDIPLEPVIGDEPGLDAEPAFDESVLSELDAEPAFDESTLSELDTAFGNEGAQDTEPETGADISVEAEPVISNEPELDAEPAFDESVLSELDTAFGDEVAQDAEPETGADTPVEAEPVISDEPELEAAPAFDESVLSELDTAFGDEVAQDAEPEIDADNNDSFDMDELSDASDMSDIASMDLEDIEARLAEAEAAGNEALEVPGADGDVTDIIGAMDVVDPGLAAIKDVLDKSDQNVAVDAALFEEPAIPDPLADLDDDESGENPEDNGKKGRKSGKDKKAKKEKNKKEKKGGFFAGLFKKKKKNEDPEEGIKDEEFPDEDDLDLRSKLDPNDFVDEEDIADMPREESDETVAAMFSGLDSIFSENGGGADEGAVSDSVPSTDGPSIDESSLDEPSLGDPDTDTPSLEEPSINESALDDPSLDSLDMPSMDELESAETADDTQEKSGPSGGGASGGGSGSSSEDGAEDGDGKKKKPKKDNIFKRILAALLEDPDEDFGAVPEEQETKLSEENKQILSEVSGEEEEKSKKGKKKKQPKEKKEKKEKKPKVKKPKKEKEKKPEEPGVKIPRKFKIRTFLVAGSVLAAILVLTVLVPSANVMSSARAAYYDKNYKDAFISMYGKDLSESDKLIYDRSKTIILLDRKYESYVQYKAMGMRDKALDALLQGLERYDALKESAEKLDVLDNLNATRLKILEALWEEFSISEDEAIEILGYSAADYSGKVKASAEGLPYQTIAEQVAVAYDLSSYDDPDGGEEPETYEEPVDYGGEEETYPDLLPEEQQFMEGNTGDESDDAEMSESQDTDERRPEGYGEKQDGTNVPVEIESDQF